LNANRQRNIHLTKYALNSVTVETPAFAESIKEGDLSFLKKVFSHTISIKI
jgi:2-oxoglutarate dehydrogenase E2 component (dihydrolipoamide succinyltransferase)